jgi:hypothetical protein
LHVLERRGPRERERKREITLDATTNGRMTMRQMTKNEVHLNLKSAKCGLYDLPTIRTNY